MHPSGQASCWFRLHGLVESSRLITEQYLHQRTLTTGHFLVVTIPQVDEDMLRVW